jgi:hypothetical protein
VPLLRSILFGSLQVMHQLNIFLGQMIFVETLEDCYDLDFFPTRSFGFASYYRFVLDFFSVRTHLYYIS